MTLMGASTKYAHAQLNPCPRVESKMPDYLEKYQGKVKEDNKKDDKPIQGMINTIKKLNYVATFLQLVLQYLSQCGAHIETSTLSGSVRCSVRFVLMSLDRPKRSFCLLQTDRTSEDGLRDKRRS